MAPKIVYDHRNCEGFFVCSSVDPERWKEDREGQKARLTGAKEVSDGLYEVEIEEDEVANAQTAAEGCPSDVIKVLDDDGNVISGPKALPIEQ